MRLIGKVVNILVAGQNQNNLLILIMPLDENEPVRDNYGETMKKFLKDQPWSEFYIIPPWLSLVAADFWTRNLNGQKQDEGPDKKV